MAFCIKETIYTSKIIKSGSLLSETKILLANWDESRSTSENLRAILEGNLLAKASRSRVVDILGTLRQRYLNDELVRRSLLALVKLDIPSESLHRILYFHTVRNDRLLHDITIDLIGAVYRTGKGEVTVREVEIWIAKRVAKGNTTREWSGATINRCASSILSALRDFGILHGSVKKCIAPIYLPLSAFAYVAMYLNLFQPSGNLLLHDPEWQLFLLQDKTVEHLFLEAHQYRLLEYHAAGSVVRVDFPVKTLPEYAYVIAQRTS
jgi:Putative inner membrane protein (DUF1819)